MFKTLKTTRVAAWSAALLPLILTVPLSRSATAQDSWSLRISEKEDELAHTNDPMWSKWLMWDIGYQRMVDRNMPYIELNNAATSTDPITQFHITIGDNRFNFAPVQGSDLVMIGNTSPTSLPLTATTVGGLGDELVVDLGNGGLAPGETVRFKIKLGIDPSFASTYAASFGASLPDYRTVLFDMNGINVYDGNTVDNNTKDNSHSFVIFDTDVQGSTAVFPDETVPNGVYYNNILRPYTAIDMVNLFQLQGAAPVPEPASIGLAVLGVASYLLGCRPRRRRLAA
ncbi:MAG TPA: PEP-CTERM sorting domain-containing protein [Lacipirellulaceae bacterium]|nr:PEP-CTERM sorting domain-containing protein [Lacipirellulaceae bacterium]